MSKFFLFSPIIFLALYGIYKALLKKDVFYHDALAIVIFAIFTLIYASVLTLAYPSTIAPSFKRYMTPILPFIFIFIPYIFTSNQLLKKNKMKITFIIFGILSIIINWVSAQYAGIGKLRDFGLDDEQIIAIYNFLENGPSSDFFNTLANVLGGNTLLFQLIGLSILALMIFFIWKPYLRENISTG